MIGVCGERSFPWGWVGLIVVVVEEWRRLMGPERAIGHEGERGQARRQPGGTGRGRAGPVGGQLYPKK